VTDAGVPVAADGLAATTSAVAANDSATMGDRRGGQEIATSETDQKVDE
jgi:hypothetical protein